MTESRPNATYTILRDGRLLPVIRMFGMGGQIVENPLHAFTVMIYEKREKGNHWLYECRPGELWLPRTAYVAPDPNRVQ